MSFITFHRKRPLTPEEVIEGFLFAKIFFWGLYLVSFAAIKSICSRSLFFEIGYFRSKGLFFTVLLASDPIENGSNYNT